jgi:hypothetical protein
MPHDNRDGRIIEDRHGNPPMDRSVEAEIDILTGAHAWSATPDNYSSLRSVVLRRDGTGAVLYGYGQTIYAKIDCRFEVPQEGRIRFEYLPTSQPQRRPPFQPTEANQRKDLGFTLTEGEKVFREDVTGFVSRFSWTLEFTEPPYPDGLSFPYSVPRVFYGYRERIGDRFTRMS